MLLHTGLDDAQLGPRLARLLAPDSPLPAREMVARGRAPLAGAEPWLALYQLWVRGGPTLAELASRTAGELPAAAVMTALADPHLPPVVLDFMARRRIRSPETLRLVVHHPRVHASTLAVLARAAPETVCSAIAKNQRRWLAAPAIAEQLLRNPCCDRATAHAVLELGAREGLAGLTELRRQALAGAVFQDSPEVHARATAWMQRSAPQDPVPDFTAGAPPTTGLSLRPGPSTRVTPDLARTVAPPHDDPQADESELDDLDLPIGDDWDDERDPLEVLPPAPRRPVALGPWPPPRPLDPPRPPTDLRPAPTAVPGTGPSTRAHPNAYAEQLARVLDPRTPLPLAMSLLHHLRVPDLRRVALARRLSPALVAAARRRTGAR